MDQLTQQLARLAEQGFSSNSIIDLSQVETLTLASLKLLAALYKLGEGHPIVLAGPSENVLRVIRVGGYRDFFAIYPSVEVAFSALQERKALNLPGQMIKEFITLFLRKQERFLFLNGQDTKPVVT
jgi:anti-anti-sigma factor